MPELSRYYRTVAIDVRGHGQSGKPDMPYSIQLFSDDLFNFMNKLEIRRANMVGLSMGAAVIKQFTLEHPEMVNSLILLSAFDHPDLLCGDNLAELRSSLLSGGLPAFFNTAIKLVVTPEFISDNIMVIEDLKKQAVQNNSAAAISRAIDACRDFDIKDSITKIAAPTLLVSGKEDVFTPLYLAERMHKSINGSKWIVMEGVGHNLLTPGNMQPLTWNVLDFLTCHNGSNQGSSH